MGDSSQNPNPTNQEIKDDSKTNITQKTNSPPENFFSRLRVFLNDTEPSVSWIVGSVSLIGGILLVIGYVNRTVDKIVLDRISPYESMYSGRTLVSEQAYDEAIPDLETAFKKLEKRFSDSDAKSGKYIQIVDSYLLAIVNTKVPSYYQDNFREILKLEEENKITFSAWHLHQIGWFYFRTGSLEDARQSFQKAIEKYKEAENPFSQSDSLWALSLISLCEGNMNLAVQNYQDAYMRNSSYAPEIVLRTIRLMPDDYWYESLIDLYDIELYLPKFAEEIRKTKDPSILRGS